MNDKDIYVYLDCNKPVLVGKLYSNFKNGTENFSFEFSDSFFSSQYAGQFFDYDLKPYSGRQYLPLRKTLFGVFSDAAPDRWGRTLMQRRERIQAEIDGRKPKRLTESDFLLGVYDQARMGALRFSTHEGGEFLSNEKDMATPPFEFLRSLEEASREFEKDENLLNDKWLKQLLVPGSSLGGARPKATIKDVENNLWIAKFPSRGDTYDVGAWEKTAHDLAKLCGIEVSETNLMNFSKLGSTFLSKRFDRENGKRVHFISAMTALGLSDGANARSGASYLNIVEFIRANSSQSKKDLEELFKRIIFNMAISNTDDHLRNHGFVLINGGWRLSPVYDINPTPEGEFLSLCVNSNDNLISIELAVDTAKYFGIDKNKALQISKDILGCVKDKWQNLAKINGISNSSIEYMRSAFSECY